MPSLCRSTGHDLASVVIEPRERALVETVTKMLSDPEWLLPVVAAHPQYRTTYYALTAAALLEDVWYDALANWVARAEPSTKLRKTPRGESAASGDYVVNGLPYSHKSGDGPQDTGVHWDALVAAKKEDNLWTSATPIAYIGSGYRYVAGTWHGSSPGTTSVPLRTVWPAPKNAPRGKTPALIRWPPLGDAEVVAIWSPSVKFDDVWKVIAGQVSAGVPANDLELVWLRAKKGPAEGDRGRIQLPGRPGFFVFPSDLLRNVPTGKNNRATLLKRDIILGLMESAMHVGLWCPMPMWYAAFAPARPPDLYLAQRGEFDRRFSPAAHALLATRITGAAAGGGEPGGAEGTEGPG